MSISAISPFPDEVSIREALAKGTLILTATQRLSRHLTQTIGVRDFKVGRVPTILPVDAWLVQTWRSLSETHKMPQRLLSASERDTLWRQVIESEVTENAGFSLVQPETAVQLAGRCRRAVKDYVVPMSSDRVRSYFESEADTRFFLQWLTKFDMRLKAEGWVVAEDLAEDITAHNPTCNEDKQRDVWFLSEEPPVPSLEKVLLGQFKRVHWFRSETLTYRLPTQAFDSRESEIRGAARWGKEQHDAGLASVIVLSDYQQDRALLEHHLRAEFGVQDQVFTDLPVNFSRGIELSKVPMFRDLLLFCRLVAQPLTRQEVTALIRSPFFFVNDDDRAVRGPVLSRLYASKRGSFGLSQVITALSQVAPGSPLERALSRARADRLHHVRLSASAWCERLIPLLQEANWPSASGLDSLEYQQADLIEAVFDAIEINPVAKDVLSLGTFISGLKVALDSQLFQPKTDISQLQVMSLGDTVGLNFETVRVVGASAERFPRKAAGLPLIPWRICHEFEMHEVMGDCQRLVSSRLLMQLASLGSVVLSYHRIADGAHNLPSEFCDVPSNGVESIAYKLVEVDSVMSPFADERGLETQVPTEQLGGVSLLEKQAMCPLKAHLSHRLDLRALESETQGLSAGERGGLLHKALQCFFTGMGSSELINNISGGAMAALAEEAATMALQSLHSTVRDRVGLPYLEVEHMRLVRLLITWMGIEKQRTIPFVIESLESTFDWTCGGLTLSLTADRVDQLQNGQQVVIDYKSGGSHSASDWHQSPLKSPQLPCYSQLLKNVGTIGIARVGGSDPNYTLLGGAIGLSAADTQSEKAMATAGVADLSELKDRWGQELSDLVRGFVEGDAVATPSANACRYCDFKIICRAHLSEASDVIQESDDE